MPNTKQDIIHSSENSSFRLREIDSMDLPLIREWKNQNSNHFFYNKFITDKEQLDWYENYKLRKDDHMYVVELRKAENWKKVGVMGYRIIDNHIDIYNVIRGIPSHEESFSMGQSLQALVSNIKKKHPKTSISCKVLKQNPAVQWYEKNGFKTLETHDSFILMESQNINQCN